MSSLNSTTDLAFNIGALPPILAWLLTLLSITWLLQLTPHSSSDIKGETGSFAELRTSPMLPASAALLLAQNQLCNVATESFLRVVTRAKLNEFVGVFA